METLSVVITEIIVCLILAWILGFVAAWFIFRGAKKSYEVEIQELEENLVYTSACSKNQEREITQQTLKIQEYQKLFDKESTSSNKNSSKKKKTKSEDDTILKLIEDNLK